MARPGEHPWVEVADLGDVTLVRFLERRIITEIDIKPIGDQLLALLDDAACRKLVISLAGVDVMSSAMVGKLIAVQRKMKSLGGQLVLCGMTQALDKVFEIGGLRRVFTILPDQTVAILSLNSPAKT